MTITFSELLATKRYPVQVKNLASHKPDYGGNFSHRTNLDPAKVHTDGAGNILDMPLLLNKPCFGFPLHEIRHGGDNATRLITMKGRTVLSQTRCGRCPDGTATACKKVNAERLLARPFAQQKYEAWLDLCNKHGKPNTFTTGDFGYAWSAFRDAMIAGGPFTSSNDAAVIGNKKRLRKKQMIADRDRKTIARSEARDVWQAAHLPPDQTFIYAADEVRSQRAAGLIDLRGNGRAPRSVAKMDAAACLITANAWFASEILGESQLPVNPGSVARWLIEKKLNEGYSYEMLRDRLRRDLRRIENLDADTTLASFWPPFDPYSA